MATVGTLQRLSAASLSKILLAAQEAASAGDPTIAIIDVRDDDYIGGHIKGSQNVPSRTLDAMLPTLVRQLQDKETVVFHCALSQQRGPAAALRYIRERERILGPKLRQQQQQQRQQGNPPTAVAADGSKDGVDGTTAAAAAAAVAADDAPTALAKEQQVYVLDRGFVGWQEMYGTDERLTEGYRKELWEDGYWG